MRNYELTLLIKPELAETQLQELLSAVSTTLQDQGALLLSQGAVGKRVLPSPIQGNRSVDMAVLKFSLEGGKLGEMEKSLKENENIIRHFLLAYLPKKAAPAQRVAAKTAAPASTAPAPAQQADAEQPTMSNEDIDKKLEEIFKQEETNL